ncbi:MAG: methyltransferase domain-containing protein [Acidimicrobiia bacterium]
MRERSGLAPRSAIVRAARRVADRVVAPYVDAIVAQLRSSGQLAHGETQLRSSGQLAHGENQPPVVDGTAAAPAGHGTSDAFHHANHALRTMELERVPKGARHALSVGANGRWYFDWFEEAVGPVIEHVGVEAFEPEPVDLQPYVRWLPSTADHMDGVDDRSIDLVFAGQTTEHLWSGELAGFLGEAHRVLRPDGWLVLDSPNRLVTEHLHWSHGGHTVELAAAEIAELVGLAGFEVVSVTGIWRCEIDGSVLQLEEGIDDPAVFARRAATARDEPDRSFVWWLVARRTDAAPDPGLTARTREIFESHWDRRLCRGLFPTPDADRLDVPAGTGGTLGQTLPFPLRAGRHEVSVTIDEGEWSDLAGFRLEVVDPGGQVLHRLDPSAATGVGATRTWAFEQAGLCFAVVARLVADAAGGPVAVRLPLAWRCDV